MRIKQPSVNLMAATQKAQDLAKNISTDLLKREYSYGVNGKSMLSAAATNIKLTWKLKNTLDTDVRIAFVTPNLRGAKPASDFRSSDAFFISGDQLIDGGDPTKKLTITSLIPDRDIEQFMQFAAFAPTQITQMRLKSRNSASGQADASNYDNVIPVYWTSPFDLDREEIFNLRDVQDSHTESPEFAEAEFLKWNFNLQISMEHYCIIQVNAGTELTITAHIGAHDSRPQRFHREIKKANEALQDFRR